MNSIKTDYVIVGAGIIGLTIAYNIKKMLPDKKVIIVEKESNLGFHSSGRNSGVLHAGFYYYPDSLKARFTKQGNRELTDYCEKKGIPINKCGKVVVVKNESELPVLYELKGRGDINGVELYIVDEKQLKDIEPNAKTVSHALWSPNTSVVNPLDVLNSLKKDLENLGVEFYFSSPYKKKVSKNSILAGNFTVEYEKLINASGLYADKIAKDFGMSKDYVIVPFKGIYLEYRTNRQLVKKNVYPVPNIRNPFLGVHFTVKVDGKIKIGPTAIPCFWRENYSGLDRFNLSEFAQIAWREINLFLRNSLFRKTAIEEVRKYIKSNILKDASNLVRDIGDKKEYVWGNPGIRAQLLNIHTLELVQDFVVEHDNESVHILNAVSPAFTASMPFTRYVVENYIMR